MACERSKGCLENSAWRKGVQRRDQQCLRFTLFQDESNLYAVALDAATGKELWRTKFATAYENAMGNGPRATPTVADGKLFVHRRRTFAAFNAKDGKELWKVNVPSSLKGEASEYGNYPLAVGIGRTTVITHTGNPDAAVAAFDTKTGKIQWQSATGKAGYSSPVLMTWRARSKS
ncbi:MAG: PQQ-binding-like beta-propeller repeat protein [Planctomycetaceae bacterium]